MARVHYWQYIVDEEGRPLENVDVRFYLADDPTTEAEIFTHPSLGGPTTTSTASIVTDGNGFFQFWIGDEFELLGGYTATQKFKLTWQRAGILFGEIDDIDVFPPIFTVDETDNTSPETAQKNKLVSNQLAYKWDTHVDSNAGAQPHNFQPVDTGSTNTVNNKLVSNSLLNYLLTALSSAGTVSIEASAAIERQFSISSWTTSGDNYYTSINHFLNNTYPVVQIRNSTTNDLYVPTKVVSLDSNSIRIFVTENNASLVTVVG
jgi:hypothetical protein